MTASVQTHQKVMDDFCRHLPIRNSPCSIARWHVRPSVLSSVADLGGHTPHGPNFLNFMQFFFAKSDKIVCWHPSEGWRPSYWESWIHSCILFHFHAVFGKSYDKQECIPVGCVPSAAVAVWGRGGCLVGGGVWSRGVSARGGVCSGGCLVLGGVSGLGVSRPMGVCLLQGGVCSGGCLVLGGVYYGGCLLAGGVCSRGVSAPGGCLLQGGVCSRGCGIPACTEADTPPPVDRKTPVKT